MCHILFTNLKYIRRFNTNGSSRLVKNIQSLQQNLTNFAVLDDTNLSRVKAYFELTGMNGSVAFINLENC